ncbi:MAG: 50S ribosomal protein L33 [Alphaproteobacteria bacterium]|jgi:large subunit ribosomal protein L33|nr:50S ribosomal protein L33 [Alphaproteobacteria bacterium]
MAKKGVGMLVRMESSAGTGFRYYKTKSAKSQEKLKLKKYDPWADNPATGKKGMHVVFEEKKMPPSKKN